jgi:hypothetical protein
MNKWRCIHVLGLGFLLCLAAVGCRHTLERQATKTQCEYEPVGEVTVWVDEVDALKPVVFSGTIDAISEEDYQRKQLSIIDENSKEWSIRIHVPGMSLPLEIGQHYEFEVQYVGGWPSASSILIWDRDGLLFAGVSDWEVGTNVAQGGVPGFGIEKISTDCGSRPHSKCYDELRNAVLKVSTDGESVMLFHGESARIGSYEVMCLTCQDVVYNSSCADAGLNTVSYAIVRLRPVPARFPAD